MMSRKTLITLLLVAAAAPVAFAQSDAAWVGGEIGWASKPVQGTRSRAEVQAELQQFRANPVLGDGSIYVGGELGYLERGARSVASRTTPASAATMGSQAAVPYQPAQVQPGREPWTVMPYY